MEVPFSCAGAMGLLVLCHPEADARHWDVGTGNAELPHGASTAGRAQGGLCILSSETTSP